MSRSVGAYGFMYAVRVGVSSFAVGMGAGVLSYLHWKSEAEAAKPPQATALPSAKKPERVGVGIGVICVKLTADGPLVLLGLRKGSHGSGTWALPGGWLEVGESFEECGTRELAEETGISGADLLSASCAGVPPHNNVMLDDPVKPCHSVTTYVEVHVREGVEAAICEPNKCAEWRWVPWRGAWPGPMFPSAERVRSSGYQPHA